MYKAPDLKLVLQEGLTRGTKGLKIYQKKEIISIFPLQLSSHLLIFVSPSNSTNASPKNLLLDFYCR
ncbi:unnamed protein product [Moneuplotes crassus]|uniref:Uncharacterized protein n=1 Tax=Euplotes crassus TaxID=5936 RepID=A0AAD1X7C5_EUPCR|nr:unnamed protein product [Moneuplotes crassus]